MLAAAGNAARIIKLDSSKWKYSDLNPNDIISNASSSSAVLLKTSFNAQTVYQDLPEHAQQFIDYLKNPLRIPQTKSTHYLISQVNRIMVSAGKPLKEMLIFPVNPNYNEVQTELLLSRVVCGLLSGFIPHGNDHLSEAAIDAVHLSNLIDNFMATAGIRYNKDTFSELPYYFSINGHIYRHRMKPDIELKGPDAMGIFFVEHKISPKDGEHGPDRIKLAWELLNSFNVI